MVSRIDYCMGMREIGCAGIPWIVAGAAAGAAVMHAVAVVTSVANPLFYLLSALAGAAIAGGIWATAYKRHHARFKPAPWVRSVALLDISQERRSFWRCGRSSLIDIDFTPTTTAYDTQYLLSSDLLDRGNLLREFSVAELVEGIRESTALNSLTIKVSMDWVDVVTLADAIRLHKPPNLQTLKLYGDSIIGEAAARVLASAFRTNTTLTDLDLGIPSLSPKGTVSLIDSLSTHATLTSLDLHVTLEKEEAEALSRALRTNTTLTKLSLDRAKSFLGDHQVWATVIAPLETNHTLTSFELLCNYLHSQDGEDIARALHTNTGLTILNLYGNRITAVGAAPLLLNTRLKGLNLGFNDITATEAFEREVEQNQTLTRLNLGGNSMENMNWSRVVGNNRCLTFLDLSWCKIRDVGARTLAEGLITNTSLLILLLGHNPMTVIGAKAILGASDIEGGMIAIRFLQKVVLSATDATVSEMKKMRLLLRQQKTITDFGIEQDLIEKTQAFNWEQTKIKWIVNNRNSTLRTLCIWQVFTRLQEWFDIAAAQEMGQHDAVTDFLSLRT